MLCRIPPSTIRHRLEAEDKFRWIDREKAIHEAAPRKLDRLSWRDDRPLRGLEPSDRKSIVEHASVLAQGVDPSDTTWAAATAYLNSLTYDHTLVLGEIRDRNDHSPVFDLYEAARKRKPPGTAVPVTLVPGKGVIWATGPRPTPDLGEPWVPTGFVFGTHELHTLDGLRAFLREVELPIEPRTLAHLLHWLLAPFPWDTRAALEDEGLLEKWAGLEEENGRVQTVASLFGGRIETPSARLDELVVALEPAGKTLVYRPPELAVR